MTRRPSMATRRRNNAPVRPPHRVQTPAGAAVVMAAAVAFLTLGAALGLASFSNTELTAGEAGPGLARLLAVTALVAGLPGVLVSVLLLGGKAPIDVLVPAIVVGVVIGGLESIFLFIPITGPPVAAPFLLLVLAFPAVTNIVVGASRRRQH